MLNLKDSILNKIEDLPRVRICDLPTQIKKIDKSFNANNNIFIKRDDLTIPNFGGNKARKEELIFGNLINRNKIGILWSSSPISNELRIISYFGYKLKKEVVLITWKNKKENIQYSPNLVASQRYGAKILYYKAGNREQYIFNKIAQKYSQNNYYIQSIYDEALGAISYIKCGEEINYFMKDNNLKFDYIFVCSSGATQIGLEIAKQIFGWRLEIIGINHIFWGNMYWLKKHFNSIWNKTLEILKIQLDKPVFNNEVKYAIPGYGQMNHNVFDLCVQFEIKEGILLDPYYSGKAFYGMLEIIKDYNKKNILFIHTGGGINIFNCKINLKKIPKRYYLINSIKNNYDDVVKICAITKNRIFNKLRKYRKNGFANV